MPSGSVGCAARYVHRRVAVNDALPLAPERTGRTATRPRAYRSHCHSPLGVPIRYARCRVAVRSTLPLALERTIPYVHRRVAVNSALPGTLDIEWQCGMRRPVRSPPSGSVRRTATRPRAYRSHCHSPLGVPIRYARCRVAVRSTLPLALERTIPYVHRRVAVRTHCHSPLIVPSRYARCRVAVWDAPPGTFTAEWQ